MKNGKKIQIPARYRSSFFKVTLFFKYNSKESIFYESIFFARYVVEIDTQDDNNSIQF